MYGSRYIGVGVGDKCWCAGLVLGLVKFRLNDESEKGWVPVIGGLVVIYIYNKVRQNGVRSACVRCQISKPLDNENEENTT